MKKSILSIFYLLSAICSFGGLESVNIYSPLGTNTVPMQAIITIPGICTNLPCTIVSNQITGDPQSLAWTKANNNWAFQQSQITSNANAIASGLGYGTGGGIGTNTGNLLVTNPLTLFNPNPYYQITGIIPLPGQPFPGPGGPETNDCGAYTNDAALGPNWFTNLCGDVLFLPNTVFDPTNMQHVVQSIAVNYGIAGGITFTNNGTFQFYVGNNFIHLPAPDFYNTVGEGYSYSQTFSGAGVSAANQTYIWNGSSLFQGQTDSSYYIAAIYTKGLGGSYNWYWCLTHSGDPLYICMSTIGASLAAYRPPTLSYSNSFSPDPIVIQNFTTNTFTPWAMFQTNWLFCGATNVIFGDSPPTISVTGSYTNFFAVTNVADFPSSDQTVTADDGVSSATFTTAVVGFGFTPDNLTFLVFPAGSATNGAPAWTPPFGTVPPFIVCQIGPDIKYLVGSEGWCSLLALQGTSFLQYNLSVDAGGNATVNLATLTTTGTTNFMVVKYVPWNSSGWSTTWPDLGPVMILHPPFTFY